MNKIILMGRLAKNPEVRYSQGANPMAVARYTLAVNRRYKKDGEPTADFINCVAFGKAGEFAEKYYQKGQLVGITGRLQVRTWEKDGQKHWATEVIVDEQYFAESKKTNASGQNNQEEFFASDEDLSDEDLPF